MLTHKSRSLKTLRGAFHSDPKNQSSVGLCQALCTLQPWLLSRTDSGVQGRAGCPASSDPRQGKTGGGGRWRRGRAEEPSCRSALTPKLSCPHFGHQLGLRFPWNHRPALSNQGPLTSRARVGFLLWADRLWISEHSPVSYPTLGLPDTKTRSIRDPTFFLALSFFQSVPTTGFSSPQIPGDTPPCASRNGSIVRAAVSLLQGPWNPV